MKKIGIKLLLLCASLFVSCGYKTNTASNIIITNAPETASESASAEIVSDGYSIECASYRCENTLLFYPKIFGMNNAEKQKELNNLIFNDAENVIHMFSDSVFCITVDYEITEEDKEKIAIKYVGQGFSVDNDEPVTVYYDSEIDLNAVKLIK